MIQDIKPYQFHNEYQPVPPQDDSMLLMYDNRQIWCREEDGVISYPRINELEEKMPEIRRKARYLFRIDDQTFYMVRELDTSLYEGYTFRPLHFLRTAAPGHLAFAGITGYQLFTWYDNRRFCGHCAAPMIHSQTERMMECPKCKLQEYPKICPAVIVGIINKDKILLSKYEGRDYKRYALIAGFAEIGETIEETIKREVMEEVGLKVKNIRFYKSQPWSFSDTLLMGFYCDLDGDDAITLDHEELALAEWMSREDIPDEGENISLTKEMMMRFKNGEEVK